MTEAKPSPERSLRKEAERAIESDREGSRHDGRTACGWDPIPDRRRGMSAGGSKEVRSGTN
jgi:hypothetical protein